MSNAVNPPTQKITQVTPKIKTSRSSKFGQAKISIPTLTSQVFPEMSADFWPREECEGLNWSSW